MLLHNEILPFELLGVNNGLSSVLVKFKIEKAVEKKKHKDCIANLKL